MSFPFHLEFGELLKALPDSIQQPAKLPSQRGNMCGHPSKKKGELGKQHHQGKTCQHVMIYKGIYHATVALAWKL